MKDILVHRMTGSAKAGNEREQHMSVKLPAGLGNHVLLTVEDVAGILQVPISWVYEHTRQRSINRIPGFRLGKYWRFRETDVLAWVERQRIGVRPNA
jgi:excisionase family DNA binding protein